MSDAPTHSPHGQQRTSEHVQVLLVDDHPAIRKAVAGVIEEATDMNVCGEAPSVRGAVHLVERLGPDVAIVDLSLEDGYGLDLVQNLQSRYPDVKTIVFSMHNEDVYAERALRAGASGYLMKSEPTKRLIDAIRATGRGEIYLSREMTSRILKNAAMGRLSEPGFAIDELTGREMDVFQMLSEGCSARDIAERLGLARKTVETYRRRAKEKLGFDTLPEFIQFAAQWGCGQRTRGQDSGPPSSKPPVEQKARRTTQGWSS